VSEMGKAIFGLLLVVVSACSTAPQANLILGSVTPAPAQIDAELASASVEPASRDRALDPLRPSLAPLLPPWQASLQDALARKAMFRPGAPRRLSLMVKALQYAVSEDTLTLFARYQLFDNPAGDPIFGTDVDTHSPSPPAPNLSSPRPTGVSDLLVGDLGGSDIMVTTSRGAGNTLAMAEYAVAILYFAARRGKSKVSGLVAGPAKSREPSITARQAPSRASVPTSPCPSRFEHTAELYEAGSAPVCCPWAKVSSWSRNWTIFA